MYLQYFGLNEYPFSITPDTSFYVATCSLQAAYNTLMVALESGEGFVKITGEVGTGKTLLSRRLLHVMQERTQVVFIPNPYLDPHALLMTLGGALGVAFEPHFTHHDLITALQHQLLTRSAQHPVVICLDEVQAMPLETLEALRLLSNLETEKCKLLQVVVFGQPELEERLNHPAIRQLRQRISFEYRLQGLSWAECAMYVQRRLQVAGYRGKPIFSDASLRLLYRYANGVPRLLNILAHKSLLSAYGAGRRQVVVADVKAAILDTQPSVNAQRRGWQHAFHLGLFWHASLARLWQVGSRGVS